MGVSLLYRESLQRPWRRPWICGVDLYTPRYLSMFTAPIVMAMPDGKLPAFNDSGTATAGERAV